MVALENRPSSSGVYAAQDAAVLINATAPVIHDLPSGLHPLPLVTTRHVYRWAREGLSGRYLEGLRGREVALTFRDLVTLRMVAVFRSYGVRPKEIRDTHHKLQQARGWAHPFAMEPVWISGLDIIIRENNIPIAPSRNWQIALDFIDQFVGPVHHLLFGPSKQAIAWEPEPGILLDPAISFGEPCLKRTRVPTETLWALHSAGDSTEAIANAYNLPRDKVESAIAWEEKLERAAA